MRRGMQTLRECVNFRSARPTEIRWICLIFLQTYAVKFTVKCFIKRYRQFGWFPSSVSNTPSCFPDGLVIFLKRLFNPFKVPNNLDPFMWLLTWHFRYSRMKNKTRATNCGLMPVPLVFMDLRVLV